MDILGSIKPVAAAPKQAQAAPILPKPQAQPKAETVTPRQSFDAKAAESRRLEVLSNAARNAPQPLGSQVFTMFKDATGQMVTRFRDQNSGKVTYIPEPDLLRLANVSERPETLVNIKA